MRPGKYNIIVQDRTTLNVIFSLKKQDSTPLDITGYSFDAQANGDVSWLPTGSFDLTPAIYGDPLDGKVQIKKTVAETTPLISGKGEPPKWDMLMTDDTGDVTKIITGKLTVEVTQTP